MRSLGFFTAWLAILPSAFGWNATGHRIIAAIAYERLNPKTRARVDELIKHHPDYVAFLRDAPTDPAARARAAFIVAAVWPDAIKGDPRFWDDTRIDRHPTPLLPGFPDMKRHTNWHYYDTPYAPDGAEPGHQDPPHALSELPRMIREINRVSDDTASYDLPWIEHIEGDLHQPLHCVSRFLKSQPKGDAGGNFVILGERSNLHSLWDDAAGRDVSDSYVTKYAAEAVAAHPRPKKIEKDPKKWIKEGFELAKSDVYTFGNETGSRDYPLRLPSGYEENARRVAQAQIAMAGYRLAAVLNYKLK
ncbi:MAG: S1/P1 nuclease [Acidobacteriia bacterium]|nr:S1/P1 nuclease [Terriglobia bacterium]